MVAGDEAMKRLHHHVCPGDTQQAGGSQVSFNDDIFCVERAVAHRSQVV